MDSIELMKKEGCKEVYSDFFASVLDASSLSSRNDKFKTHPFVLFEDGEIIDYFQSLNDALYFYMSDK